MIKYLTELAKALNPKIADTPEQIFVWRQTVAFGILLSLSLHLVALTHAYGGMSFFGISGFAKMNQMAGIEQDVRDLRLLALEEQIDRVTARMCEAERMKNQAALDANRYHRDGLMRQYGIYARASYRLKSCNELLVPTG